MAAAMPEHVRRHRDVGQRRRQHAYIGHRQQAFDDAARQRGDQVGRRDHERDAGGVRQHQRDAAAQPARRQNGVDDARAAAVGRYLHMAGIHQVGGRRVSLDGERLAERVVVGDERHQPVVPQPLGAQLRAAAAARRDGDIDLAGNELLRELRAVVGAHVQIDPGSVTAQMMHQRGQEPGVVEIDGRELDGCARGRRLERGRQCQGSGNIGQRPMDRPGQFQRPGGRLHAPVAPHEQRVVEQAAQPVERLAHGGLAEPVARGGAGNVALRHEGVEYDQEVEVDRSQIPFGYDMHVSLSFPRWRAIRHHGAACRNEVAAYHSPDGAGSNPAALSCP